MVQPKVGDPNTLVMQYLPANTPVSVGEYVVTSGTISSGHESLFPRGIAIGQVTSVGEEAPYKSVEVQPAGQPAWPGNGAGADRHAGFGAGTSQQRRREPASGPVRGRDGRQC